MAGNTFATYARDSGYQLPAAGSIANPTSLGGGGGPYAVIDDFGSAALFNSEDDVSEALQAAVDSLVETGGTVWLPPGRVYPIGQTVTIKSLYPIWIRSEMMGGIRGGGANTTNSDSAVIKPIGDMGYLLVWDTPDGHTQAEAGGGGVHGLAFSDMIAPNSGRNYAIDGAIHAKDATLFGIYDCNFEWLKGRAVRFGLTIYAQIRNVKAYNCGDTGKPTFDLIADGAGELAYVWVDRLFAEICTYGSPTFAVENGALWGSGLYFEDGINNDQSYIDSTGGGVIGIDNFQCNATEATSIVLGAPHSYLANGVFNNTHGTNPQLNVAAAAFESRFVNLRFNGTLESTGASLLADGAYCQFTNLHLGGCGSIDNGGVQCVFDNVFMYWPRTSAGSYAIDLAEGSILNGGILNGTTNSVCHGVRAAASTVKGFTVHSLDDANGIVSTSAADQIIGNKVHTIGTGTPYTYVNGTIASGNYGYTSTASDDNSDDAVTLNAESGIVTTKALTTAADASYLLTINNSMVAATSRVVVTAGRGTGMTQGFPVVSDVQVLAGQIFVRIYNLDEGTGAFNAPVRVSFSVIN